MSPDDICGRCTHARYDHNPPKKYSYAKTGYSSGNAHNVTVLAPTCCWSNPMCTCTEFVECLSDGKEFPEDLLSTLPLSTAGGS